MEVNGSVHLLITALAALLPSCNYVPGTNSYKIAQTEIFIDEIVIDPESTKYRNVTISSIIAPNNGHTVCGEINARNKMGGYTGFTRFINNAEQKEVLFDPTIDVVEQSRQATEQRGFCSQLDQFSCPIANKIEAEIAEQESFDVSWGKFCARK